MRPFSYTPWKSFLMAAIWSIGSLISTSTYANCVFSNPFSSQELDIGNLLTWSTTLEMDNETFVIQKSLDGLEFETEGVIRGAKNSEEERHYRYLDVSIGNSKAFYRLIDLDSKGNYEVSHTIIIDRQQENNLLVTSISNTETERFFSMTMESGLDEQISYKLLNADENVVIDGELQVVKGLNAFSLDLKDLDNGRYKLMITARDELEELYLQKDEKAKSKTNFALKNKKEDSSQ